MIIIKQALRKIKDLYIRSTVDVPYVKNQTNQEFLYKTDRQC